MPIYQKKPRRVKLQPLNVVYEQSTSISPEEAERRLEHAFSVLFEETIRIRGMPMEARVSSKEIPKLEQGVKIK